MSEVKPCAISLLFIYFDLTLSIKDLDACLCNVETCECFATYYYKHCHYPSHEFIAMQLETCKFVKITDLWVFNGGEFTKHFSMSDGF